MKDALLKIAEAFEALEARIAAQDERIAALEERLEAQQQRIEEMENAEPEVEVELVPMPVEDEPEPEMPEEPEMPAEPEPEIPETPEEPEIPAEPETQETPEPEIPADPEPVAEPEEEPEPVRPIQTSLFGMPVDDIRHAISLGDRFLFQRELFAGNGELMQKTLNALNEQTSYNEAVHYISQFDWDKESSTYELFLNVLKRRFA